jgi:hypothetical protein
MEEDLMIEEGDVMIEKEHTDAQEWIYKEKRDCPLWKDGLWEGVNYNSLIKFHKSGFKN